MKPSLFFAKRYLFSKNQNHAINIIVWIASLGVFFSSLAFIIVLSGFSGIRTFNLNLLKLTDPDIKILPLQGKYLKFSKELKTEIEKNQGISAYAKVLEDKVFIDYQNKQKVAEIKGVDRNFFQVIPLDTTIFMGNNIDTELDEALVGVGLANDLSIILSNPTHPEIIKLIVPIRGKKYIKDPRKSFHSKYAFPVGVYQTSSDHDKLYIYTGLKFVQELFDLSKDKITQIEIKVKSPELTNSVQNQLKSQLKNRYRILNRKEQNPLIFKMLNTENLMTYFVLFLILVLAMFNIIGTIIMIIIDKSINIRTLKILGLKTSDIKKIFLIQGVSMTMLSGIMGIFLGIILIWIQLHFPFLYIPQTQMPYPVELHTYNVLIVLFTLIFMSFLSTLIATKRIKA